MFKRILIANRGEIACRIIRTCKRLNIETVAVYSSAEANSRHVSEADYAVCLGGPGADESYLRADRIVAAAISHAAQAIHPGYGFLSEKLELVDACIQNGIAFIGPNRRAIESMGSKIESKQMARAAGVDCLPGYDGDEQTDSVLLEQATRIAYPLLIKASAGGGGKGMRIVHEADDFIAALRQVRQEARAAFGDDRVLLEKAIANPRHLEVQIVGDQQGNLVHLFERECSIQRRFQKLIEEAPANHLPPATADKLYQAALQIGRSIGYDNAGTVEFVLDSDQADTPYFLEVNTRLQVEHPVTELTTGIDVVAWQLSIAAGEPLPLAQADITRHGWAIEARINAEDARHDYRASIGSVLGYSEPEPAAGIRIDSGLQAGSEITPYFDSMVAKAIGYGASRAEAVTRTRQAIEGLRIEGITSNADLLIQILDHPAFEDVITTRFIDTHFSQGPAPEADTVRLHQLAVSSAWSSQQVLADKTWHALRGLRLTSAASGGARIALQLRDVAGHQASEAIQLISHHRTYQLAGYADLQASVQHDHLNGIDAIVQVTDKSRGIVEVRICQESAQRWFTWLAGRTIAWAVSHELDHSPQGGDARSSGNKLSASLPGRIAELMIKEGDRVDAHTPVLTMEAMKLYHTLNAPCDGLVRKVHVQQGDIVSHQQLLVEFEQHPTP